VTAPSPLLLVCALSLSCGPARSRCDLSAPGAPWIAFTSSRAGSFDLAIVRADGTCERPLTSAPSQDLFPTWSPAGKLAFASDRGGSLGIWVHDLASGVEDPFPLAGLRATYPAYAPDGSMLAFEGSVPGSATSGIYVVTAGGGAPVALVDDPSVNGAPAWSPDGSSVYFVSNRTGRYEVFSVPVTGGAASQVTRGSGILGRPTVSPDGAALAWTRATGGRTEVVRMALDGGAVAVITSEGDSEPSFAPAGGALVVRSYRYGQPELVLVDPVNGGAPLRLTFDGATNGTPSFSPRR
jgi:TolB protein